MKSNNKKRVLAAILCMVMVLTNNVSALAEGEGNTDVQTPAAVSETTPDNTPAAVSEPESTGETPASEPSVTPEQTQPQTPPATPEQTPTETPGTPEQNQSGTPATPEQTPTETPGTPEQNQSGTPATPEQKPTETPGTPEQNQPGTPATPEQKPTETPGTPEQTQPGTPEQTPTETPATPEKVFSEAKEFTKEFKDASGQLVQKITAKLPAGAFEAETSAITMEASYVKASTEKHLKSLMTKRLPEGNELGDYFLYKIEFKVNGEAKDSLKPIEITFAKSDLEVKDTKKANVFYFDPADPKVSGDKDEVVEITQRSELIESFQKAGKSTANIDKDYDLSSIEIGADQKSGKIVLEGRKSTIYGCYIEKEPEAVPEEPTPESDDPANVPEAEAPEAPETEELAELQWEDEEVQVKVAEVEKDAIPEGATLKVVPITSENAETKEQYEEVGEKIQEKIAEEEKVVAGFLAYDITFVDAEGNEIEPNGKVKVSMNYKNAAIPQEVAESESEEMEVTLLHLEEDEKGEVKDVVDMGAEETTAVNTLITTEGEKIQGVEAETDSFSVFTIIWTNSWNDNLDIELVDEDGNEIKLVKDVEIKINKETSVKDLANQYPIEGYNFIKAEIPSRYDNRVTTVTAIKKIKVNKYSWKWQYKDKDGRWIDVSHSTIQFVYEKDENESGGGSEGGSGNEGVSKLGTPEHHKRIVKNADDDYTLSLDVTGKVGEVLPIDILLIVDKSGSMGDNKKYSYVTDAITELKNTLNKSKVEINMAAVTFSSAYPKDAWPQGSGNEKYYRNDNLEDAWISQGWTSMNWFNFSLNKEDCDGGTNWQAGVRKGEELLKARKDNGHRKYVLFLTDGSPTFRYRNGSTTTTQGDGNSDSGNKNYTAAKNEWFASPNLKSADTTKYIIDASGGFNQNCSDFAGAVSAKYLKGSDGESLKNGFAQIANDILKPVYKDVTIEDTLSAYVELTANPQFTVTKRMPDEEEKPIDAKNIKTEKVSIKVEDGSIKESTKIILELEDGNELDDGAVYTISFHVKPTDYAKQQYAEENQYPHTGDKDTGETSSEQQGFYSNDSAILHYRENNGALKKAEYPKPVVQVNVKTADLTFTKVNSKNTPLAGAEFELAKEDSKEVKTSTSGLNGNVTFVGLTVGTYTLKETKAPTGYERATETWSVIVTEDPATKKLTAKLFQSDGTTPVENNQIINYTEVEMAEKNLKYNKTATVSDEEERIFDINLTAATSGQGAGEAGKGASIVLVLDASKSMNENGKSIKNIKDAAKRFVNSTYSASKSSEIAVVWYQGHEGNRGTIDSQSFVKLSDERNVKNVTAFIDSKDASGGTPMGDALQKANELLPSAKNNEKYVLFFTDGMPGHSSDQSFNCKVANNASHYAKLIKNTATLYTVGYKLDGKFRWKEGHDRTDEDHNCNYMKADEITATAFLEKYIASTGKATTVENADDLNQIFESIAEQIGELYTLTPESIVDVIDARFELTETSKKELQRTYGNNIEIQENKNGTTTITWTGEAAIIGNENAGTDGTVKGPWSASFQIQAKDDFIGGNMIPTNGSASGIYLEDTTKFFPQPSVNVQPLSLSMKDKEVWMYKGDPVTPIDYANELYNTLEITELDGDTTTETGKPEKLPELTEEQKQTLINQGSLVVNEDGSLDGLKYIYPNTSNDAIGYFKYTYEVVKNEENQSLGKMEDHKAETVGEDVEQYKITVQFIPYSVDKRAGMLPGIDRPSTEPGNWGKPQKGGTELTLEDEEVAKKLTAEATYIVNVIAGEIQITKTLEKPATTDQTFTFEVTSGTEGTPEYFNKIVEITVKQGEKEATYAGNDLKDLPRGTYRIVEVDSNNYEVKDIQLKNKVAPETGEDEKPEISTNCQSTLTSPEYAEFSLGYDENEDDVIINGQYNKERGGVFGGVAFTNEEVISNWEIVKQSANGNNRLEGAEFKLSNKADKNCVYHGRSDEKGKVVWTLEGELEPADKLEAGTYTLEETKAPVGYAKSEETWTLEITRSGALKSIKDAEGNEVKGIISDNTTQYIFENEISYTLPQSGGSGIFTYIMSGTLLLMAAALMLYRMKYKGVLKG